MISEIVEFFSRVDLPFVATAGVAAATLWLARRSSKKREAELRARLIPIDAQARSSPRRR
jgi:hypothetical protein